MKTKTKDSKNKSGNMLQLKIVLKGYSPVIWRRVLVPAGYHFGHLHTIIQIAMGWTNSHLHQFEINGENYTNLDYETELSEDHLNEKKYKLIKLIAEGDKFIYTYDFGDGWQHDVHAEKLLPQLENDIAPVCLAGANACPPEDCGGIGGYYQLLETIKNPKDPEYEEKITWLGEFDPGKFDLAEVNAALKDCFLYFRNYWLTFHFLRV